MSSLCPLSFVYLSSRGHPIQFLVSPVIVSSSATFVCRRRICIFISDRAIIYFLSLDQCFIPSVHIRTASKTLYTHFSGPLLSETLAYTFQKYVLA